MCCFLCSGLSTEEGRKVLEFINSEGSVNEDVSITDDGKYRNRIFYNAIPNRKWGNLGQKEYGRTFLTKLTWLRDNLGCVVDGETTVIDISYSKLKEYYEKNKNSMNFVAPSDAAALNEIKAYFDEGCDRKKLYVLAGKYLFDLPDTKEVDELDESTFTVKTVNKVTNDDSTKFVFDKVLEVILKTETGCRRIESLLLLRLLSFVESHPLEVNLEKIVVLKTNDVTSCANGTLAINFDDMDCIDLSTFAVSSDDSTTPKSTRAELESIKRTVKEFMKETNLSGSFVYLADYLSNPKNEKLLKRGFNLIACSIIHELSHAYDAYLLGVTSIPDVDLSSAGAYLENEKLSDIFIPLLNTDLKNKIETCYNQTTGSPNAIYITLRNSNVMKQPYIAANFQRILDRELAREICSNDNPSDMLVISGAVPVYVAGTREFILIVDYQNENAIRREFGEPYVIGHGRYKLFAGKKSDAQTQVERLQPIYDPYPIGITSEEGKYKIFEPYVLEEVIGDAIKQLKSEGKEIELFKYTVEPSR
jgi:hypothetical protein